MVEHENYSVIVDSVAESRLVTIGNRWRYSLLFFYRISICLYFFTIYFQT